MLNPSVFLLLCVYHFAKHDGVESSMTQAELQTALIALYLSNRKKVVSMDFMRKYIHFAKMLKPVLTEEAAAFIADAYSHLRSQDQISSDVARVSSRWSLLLVLCPRAESLCQNPHS